MESESGTYTNSLTNSAPVTNVAQRNIEVREQHISNVTKVQKQYNSYYEPEKVHRKRRFTMVPLSRIVNPYIGHKQHLERIGHALKTHSRVALWGRGGIGKSHIAAYFGDLMIYREVDNVFWINGKSVANFNRDMADAAEQIGTGRLGTQLSSTVASSVKRWMESDRSGSWLMILDDAGLEAIDGKELDSDSNANAVTFGQWLPRPSIELERTVLITTSNRRVAQKWCSDDAIFLIPLLTSSEAVQLLRNRSGDETSPDSDAARLVEALDRHPSAITAAGAFIRENDINGMTITRYHRQSISQYTRLKGLPKDTAYPWIKTIDRIYVTEEKAVDVLALMCCLDQVWIPDSAIFETFILSCSWSQAEIFEALSVLLNYHMITKDESKSSYSIPRLVQETARDWFKEAEHNGRTLVPLHQWYMRALDCLIREYEKRKAKAGTSTIYAHLQQCCLLPHVNEFRHFCKGPDTGTVDLTESQAAGIIAFASLYMGEGENKHAESLLLYVLKHSSLDPLLQAVAKVDLAESLRSRSVLDNSEKRLKKATDLVRDARDMVKAVIQSREQTEQGNVGVASQDPMLEHIDSILYFQIYPCFARIYSDRAKYDRAALFQDMVIGYYDMNGKDNDFALIDAILGQSKIYWQAGKFRKALNLQLSVKDKLKEKPFSEDPDIHSRRLEVKAALVRTYHSLREMSTALQLAWEVCNGRLRLLGECHMKTLESERDLAFCLEDSDQLEDAKTVLERVVEKFKQKLGPKSREVQQLAARISILGDEIDLKPSDSVQGSAKLDFGRLCIDRSHIS